MTHDGNLVAFRALVRGRVQGVGFRDAVRRRATRLGVSGWVRNAPDGTVEVHAEGPGDATGALLAFLQDGPRGAEVIAVEHRGVKPEGHEQFAIRGVPAGRFIVVEHAARTRHFDLRLEVGGVMRSWAVPKEPSLDPAVKRLAVQVPDHRFDPDEWAGRAARKSVYDRGLYEHGGRVGWPEALDRGHAVFVLHGAKLGGGFALQRTGPDRGEGTQWLLVKRRAQDAPVDAD